MSEDPSFVRRGTVLLHPDPRRVIARLFLPGQETLASGISRADAVVQRILAMPEEEVAATLAETTKLFEDRYHNFAETLADHFALVAHRLPPTADPSAARRALIGAYFTQEYSVEAAALFNPSLVAHPDQSGLEPNELRFIMSVRAVGEGHISSIEFRTGVLSHPDCVRLDPPGRHLVTGQITPATMSREFLRDALAERSDASIAGHILSLLPAQFYPADLEAALTSVARDRLTRSSSDAIIGQIRWIASCNYMLRFRGNRALSERVIFPTSPDECKGVEDARFTRFIHVDGHATYLATYTAFDGSNVGPHLLKTEDFVTFESIQLVGPAAKNKGMALFPRLVRGRFLALSRWDRESIGIATSPNARNWGSAITVQTPVQPWELIQLGNCGPPIETPQGWLVLTHGVGPMRTYGIGAVLLDLRAPTTMIGALRRPLLTPTEDERDGYVPNVVYSCGSLLHDQTLVLPYGCSDSSIRFAFVDLPELLSEILASPVPATAEASKRWLSA